MSDKPAKTVTMSENELRDLVKDVVNTTLTTLGIAHEDPIETQKDMQYMRSSREASEAIKSKTWMVLVGLAVVGLVNIAIQGLKEYFKT